MRAGGLWLPRLAVLGEVHPGRTREFHGLPAIPLPFAPADLSSGESDLDVNRVVALRELYDELGFRSLNHAAGSGIVIRGVDLEVRALLPSTSATVTSTSGPSIMVTSK